MNLLIYILIFFVIIYFLLKFFSNSSPKIVSKVVKVFIILGIIAVMILLTITGKFLISLPLALLSLALVKLKGLSIFQLIGLFRLIQTLRSSGRFSFKENYDVKNSSSLSLDEAYKILNLDRAKKISKEDVNKSYLKIQKKIHPDVSPETARLSSIVNEAKELVLKDIS